MTASTIREFLKGKKAYITAALGALGAVAAWADGQIDNMSLLAALAAAAYGIFIRAGMDHAAAKALENANLTQPTPPEE